MLNETGSSIDLWVIPVSIFYHLLKVFPPFFVVCDLINNYWVILEILMINHKNVTSQLVGLDSQKSSRDLLKEFVVIDSKFPFFRH